MARKLLVLECWPVLATGPGDNVLRNMRRPTDLPASGANGDGGPPTLELLAATSNERLEEVVARLKQTRPAAEICDAMMKLIALAPLSDFQMLLDIYRRHCVPACK